MIDFSPQTYYVAKMNLFKFVSVSVLDQVIKTECFLPPVTQCLLMGGRVTVGFSLYDCGVFTYEYKKL